MADNEAPETEGGPDKKKGGLLALMPMIVSPVLAGVVAFGVSYLDPFGSDDSGTHDVLESQAGTDTNSEHDEKSDDHGKSSSHGKSKKKGKSADLILLPLEPIVVSLSQDDRTSRRPARLRIAIVVEGHVEESDETEMRLRDAFTATIRTVSPETLGGPTGLETLRDVLLKDAETVLGEGVVTAVLITDYLLT